MLVDRTLRIAMYQHYTFDQSLVERMLTPDIATWCREHIGPYTLDALTAENLPYLSDIPYIGARDVASCLMRFNSTADQLVFRLCWA